MKKRNIGMMILLTIVTCFIYPIVVSYLQAAELEKEGAKLTVPPILILLLMFFISPAGGALLGYCANNALAEMRNQRNMAETDNMVLWLVIGILLPVFAPIFVQHGMNQYLDETTAA